MDAGDKLFVNKRMCAESFNHVWLFGIPWTVACQSPLPIEFSRQDYWSVVPLPAPRDLSNPGIELASLTSCIGKQILYHLHRVVQLVKNSPANAWGFPDSSVGKESTCSGSAGKEFACNEGDLGSIHRLGRSPGKGIGSHYSILAWRIPWTV